MRLYGCRGLYKQYPQIAVDWFETYLVDDNDADNFLKNCSYTGLNIDKKK